jgi:hypothetical protein
MKPQVSHYDCLEAEDATGILHDLLFFMAFSCIKHGFVQDSSYGVDHLQYRKRTAQK